MKRKEFYIIKKLNGYFFIKREEYYLVELELSCKKYSNVFQYKHAIIAELVTGGYELYLPSTEYDLSYHDYPVADSPLTLVASNISEYLTYEDIFAFKKDSKWYFLLLHNFELELDLDDVISVSLSKRLSELPSIQVTENTEAYFKPGFEILYNGQHSDDKHHLAIFHADQDYLIDAKEHECPLYTSGIKITDLGTATKLPGGDGRFFRAKNDLGESWYHNQYSDGCLYSSIKPMKKNEYPAIYSNKYFSGYWKKDHDGFIIAFTFLSNSDHTSFSLRLPCPAKKVNFVKTIYRTNLNGADMENPSRLWSITSASEEDFFLLVSDNHYVRISLKDFIN